MTYPGYCPHCGEYELLRNYWHSTGIDAWVCEECEDLERKRQNRIKEQMKENVNDGM